MNPFRVIRSVPWWAAAVLFAACGGGGGSGPGRPSVAAATLASGATGVPYPRYVFTVASGGTAPFTWSETGTLPPGLSLSATGQLSGTPVVAGTYPVTITATDSSAPPLTGSLPVSLVIADSPIVVSAAPPPAGIIANAYAFAFSAASGGSPPFTWTITSGALPPGLALAANGSLSGAPTAAATFRFTITATDSAPTPATNSASFAIVVTEAGFTSTGSMTIARSGHTATLLNDGKVLVAGGQGLAPEELWIASAELYDPATGMFTATGSMTAGRTHQTATLLNDAALPNYGRVLIAGPVGESAELYNPATGTFTATGSMHHARNYPNATLLSNTGAHAGTVLIVGGNTTSGDLVAELYDPRTGTFSDTGSTTILRTGPTATLLLDGRGLVAGGDGVGTAELYNPASGTFIATGSTLVALGVSAATRLRDGRVLIEGGRHIPYGGAVTVSELYDPGTGTFSSVGNQPVTGQTTSLRGDGTVLAAGGVATVFTGAINSLGVCVRTGFSQSVAAAQLFAPQSQSFTATGSLITARSGHSATVLADGTVLIAGGIQYTVNTAGNCHPVQSSTLLSSAEVFK